MEFFAPFFNWWIRSALDNDGLRALHPLGWCALGLSDRLIMFPEARKGLPMRVYRWISGGRADSFKEVVVTEVELGRHHSHL